MQRPAPTAVLLVLSSAGLACTPGAQAPAAAPRPARETAEPPAWIDLFDGRTLAGWVTSGGRYDGLAVWTVEDGAITGRVGPGKAGGLLYTEQRWHSFDLEFETRIDWPFDSGIFVRMAPEAKGAQITLDWRPGGEIGGVYSEGWLEENPEGAQHFLKDAWNRGRVRCTGRDFHLEFWLDDRKLTDYQLPFGEPGYVATGRIGVQVHGGLEPDEFAARFRGLRLRELPVFDTREFTCDDGGFLTPREGSGFEPLLDEGLTRFEAHGGDGRGFACDGRVLRALVAGGAHHLATREDFTDFVLRMDFRVLRRANSGVFLRARRGDANPAFSGCEIQILDDFHWEEDTGSKLKEWQFTGSLYGAVPAGHPGTLYPLGRWNSYEIRCQGTRIRCELNGVELWDVDTAKLDPEQGEAFARRAKSGFVGLQRHAPAGAMDGDAYAWFRNVFVKRL
ncbi:MAG: DUF1080 domain-containing protein [Planctomycetes bacterium]|nr:DUF1080 domain-containing protein [Planctomycetota bacterium]